MRSSTLKLLARRRAPGSRGQNPAKGMTLLEIMIVIAILGLIASVVVVGVMNYFDRAKVSTTRLKIHSIQEALDMYRSQEDDYPSQSEGLRALTSPPNGGPSYLKEKGVPKDAWGQEFLYFNPARNTNGGNGVEVISKGPDKQEGTADDIKGDDGKAAKE